MKQWAFDRLKERTTYLGLLQLVAILTGYNITPEYQDMLITLAIGLSAGNKVITKE